MPRQDSSEETVPLPRTTGGFRLLRELGRGGMGVVYEAEELSTSRRVALKLLLQERRPSDEAYARFAREARLAAAIAHPNCVFVLGAFEVDGVPAIATELLSGETLADRVVSGTPVPVSRAVSWMLEVLEGLEAAQRAGVIHRDVKPANCFFGPDGHVKVGDFGLSRALEPDERLTQSGQFLGSPHYASPEQIRGDKLDFRTDIYSAGATLYALLTGKPPFPGSGVGEIMARILSEPATPPRKSRPEVPWRLQRVVQRAMAKRPADRYRSYARFRAALAPHVATHLPLAGFVRRLGAFGVDLALGFALLALLGTAQDGGIAWLAAAANAVMTPPLESLLPLHRTLICLLAWVPFEVLWGWSLGKQLFGLRLVPVSRNYFPRLRILVRALAFGGVLLLAASHPTRSLGLPDSARWTFSVLPLALFVTGIRRRGLVGLHDRLTGIRVVEVKAAPEPAQRAAQGLEPGRSQFGAAPVPAPAFIGPYRCDGLVGPTPGGRLLWGWDLALQRSVWLQELAHRDQPPAPRHDRVTRPAQLHWIDAFQTPDRAYIVWESPGGIALVDYVKSKALLPWGIAYGLLVDLVDDLALQPRHVGRRQLWIGADGRLRILDVPVGDNPPLPVAPLVLLTGVSRLLLLDHLRPPAILPPDLPIHAEQTVRRLTGLDGPPHETIETARAALKSIAGRRTRVSRLRRASQMLLALVPAIVMAVSWEAGDGIGLSSTMLVYDYMAFYGLPATVLAFAVRGGLSLYLTGIEVRTRRGVQASRLRRTLRATLTWLPALIVYLVVDAALDQRAGGPACFALLGGAFLYGVYRPRAGLQDLLAGTRLVPR